MTQSAKPKNDVPLEASNPEGAPLVESILCTQRKTSATSSPGNESHPIDLELLVDSIPALIHSSLPNGYLDYFNQRWREYLGLPLEAVEGWKWVASIHPDDVAGIVDKWRACLASGEVFEYDARVRRADGEYRWMAHRKVPLRDRHGEIVKWLGSSIDIEDRKRAEQALRRSEFYLSEGQRLTHMGSWAFDSAGFNYWSPELFRMHGLDPASKAPSVDEYLDCVHAQDRESMANLIKRILADASPFDATKRIVRPDGQVRYIHCVGAVVDENQRLKKYVGSAIDVTEHELLTQELRRREAYLAEAQRLSHTGSFGWSVPSGEILWSEETFRIFEYDQATHKPTVDLVLQRVHPEDTSLVQQTLDHAAKGNDFDLEHRLLMPGGSVKHVRVVAHAVRDELGNVECIGAVTDITERRRAEQRLVAQHTVTQVLAEAATLEEAAPKILQAVCECLVWDLGELWRTDRASGVLRCVEVWHKESIGAPQFVASSRDRTFMPGIGLPGRVWSSREPVYIPDVVLDSNFPRAPIAACEGLHAAFAFPILLGSEVVGVMDFFSHEIRQPDQDLLDMMATIGSQIGQFIERKRAEEELRRSEGYLAAAQRLSLTGSFGWNVASGEILWSEETFRIFEYDRATCKPALDLVLERVHPEDIALVQQTIDHAAKGNDFDLEHRLLMPGGSVKHVHVMVHAVRDELGNVECIGAVTDITERKRAEQTLRESETYLAEAQRLSQTGSWAWNTVTGEIRYWSEECYRVLGFDPAGPPPRFETFFQRIHPDDQAGSRERFEQAIRERADFEVDYRIVHPGTGIRDIHVVGHAVLARSGDLVEFVGTVIDITERKRAERELQQLVDLVPQVIVVLGGPDGRWIHANRVAEEYTGLTLDEIRSVDMIGRIVHPDDAEEVRGARERGFLEKRPFELEARLLGKDGVYRWFLIRYNPLVEEGHVRRWYATATEIESRKKEEERIRRENVRLEERTRIAQELHDTLLQTFLSASMQLSVALDGVAPDALVKPRLDRILQLMNQGIAEGRNTIHGLRSPGSHTLDLVVALSHVQQELAVQPDIDFRVIVAGLQQPLRPPIQEEIYRIGREALVNAFRHSQAKHVEFELEYAESDLRLRVRDNGCGIDPEVLDSGRTGHWGLAGMHERAEKIGARLKIRTPAEAGTEVELSVPNHIAFELQPSQRPLGWLARIYPENTRAGDSKGREGTQ